MKFNNVVDNNKEDDNQTDSAILIVCGYDRADRYRDILENKCKAKYEIIAFSNERATEHNNQLKRVNKMTTHGGYVYARLKIGLNMEMEIQKLHSMSSFCRFYTNLFPTRFKYKCEKNIDSNKIELFLKTLTNKLIIKKSNKIRIRLHVYTNNNSTKPFLKQITNVINEKYKNHIELSPVNFDKVIVIVVLDDIFEYNIITSKFFNSIIKKHNNDDALLVCRAAYKLLDGFELLKHRCIHIDTNFSALDVGSSPGGWTEALLAYGMKNVIAIDPGKMNNKLMETGKVQHIALPAQDAAKTLHKENSSLKCSMIVCDVNTPIQFAINKLILPLIQFLNVGAPIVLTLKLPKRHGKDSTRNIAIKVTKFAKEALKLYFNDIEIYHLLGNTVCERTLIGIRNDTIVRSNNSSTKKEALFDVHKKWLEDFHKIKKFVVEENRNQLPFDNARNKKERRFAKWVNKQHQQYYATNRRGGWNKRNIDLLEKCDWWNWSTGDERFNDNILKLKKWMMKNNNNALPKSYNDVEDGVFLAKFIESERRAYHLSDPNIDPGTSTKYNKRRKLELESIDGFTWKYERNINKNNGDSTARSEDRNIKMQHNLAAKLNFLLGPPLKECV